MKRILSLVLVTAMLLSMVAVAPFYSSAVADTVGTEAYYFGGSVQYAEIYGKGSNSSPYDWFDPVPVKDGDSSKGQLLINGKIEEGEWGNPSFIVSSDYAASNDGVTTRQNGNYEEPSAENTYFYYIEDSYINKTDTPMNKGMNYKVYLMWDEDYLYIAADVDDVSGHKNGKTGNDLWDGDVFQFRVDKDGPYTLKDGYNPNGTDDEGNHIANYPWRSSVYKSGLEFTSEVPNFIIGHSTTGNGTTIVRDNANRYYPHEVLIDDPETEEVGDMIPETQYSGIDVSYTSYREDEQADYDAYIKNGGCAPEVKEWGPVYAAACPEKITARHHITNYEAAIPWEYIDEDFLAKAGIELGLSTMVIDRQNSAAKSYGAFLEWGNGINNHRTFHDYQTCNGSNALTLSATAYNEREYHEHTFGEATCIEPATCTVCGYQRGYKAGHEYTLTEYKLPTDSEEGYAKAICAVCGDNPTRTMAPSAETVYKYMYRNDGVINLSKRLSSSFDVVWTQHTWSKNEEGNWEVTDGSTVYNIDGANQNEAKTMLWLADQTRPQIGEDVTEMVNPYGFTVLDMTNMVQTGTYFEIYDFPSKNYAVNMEVDLWNLFTQAQKEKEGETGYHDSLMFWFGENLTEYAAGIFIVEDKDADENVIATQAFFAIGPSTLNSSAMTIEQFKETALSYKEIDLDELDIEQGTWNTMTFFADFDANIALLFWDGEYVAGAYDYHFARPEDKNTTDPIIRLFNMGMCVTDLEAGNSSIASNYAAISGGEGGGVDTEPVETEPVETEPVETEPVETEPVETEPVETEPVETEPVEPELGSFENPYLLNLNEMRIAVNVPAGETAWIQANEVNNTVANVGYATGSNYVILYGTQFVTPEGEDNAASVVLDSERGAKFSIKNESEEDIVLYMTLTEAAGEEPNSKDNPEVLELQNFMGRLVAFGEAELAAKNQGYWYNIIAPADGVLTVGASAYNPADYSELGWMYFVNNLTSTKYGDTHWSDEEEPVYSEELEVKAGDVIEIFVSTYDPADEWNAPAGTVSVNAFFKAPSPIGYWDNPEIIEVGDHANKIEAGNQDVYYSQWTADKNGEITVTMNDATGWMYSVTVERADGTMYVTDTHWFDDEEVVASETIEVLEGDVVTVFVNTYDPADMFSNPEGTINWNLKFAEKIEIDGFTLLVTGEEIDGQYHVYYELFNNPGIWSIAANLKFNADLLELVEVKNGAIFAGEGEYVEVPAVDGTHRYFANGEDEAFSNKTENGILVEYVFNIKEASDNYGIEVTVNADDVFNSDNVNQPLTVINTLEVKTVTITVDGVVGEYTIGDTFELTAEQLTVVDGVGYVFDAWVVDGVVVDDAEALTLTFVVPENDVTIATSTFVHGNVDNDESNIVAGFDVTEIFTLIKNDTYSKYGDLDFDGKLTASDSIILMQIIKGSYKYE